MKHIIKKIALVIPGLVILSINTHAQKINFSGKWKVNLIQSDFGNLPTSTAATEYNIVQDKNIISFERTVILKDSMSKSKEVLTFGGLITESDLKNKKKESSIKWSADRSTMIETARQSWVLADGKIGQYQSLETFTLSMDKKTLFYKRKVMSDKVNFSISAVYTKE